MSLQSLRKSNTLDKLLQQVKEDSAPQAKKSYTDERLWKPQLDKSGNGYAVIRFLPQCDNENLPWVKMYKHAFQGPTGKWFIENSLTTLNQKDPVSEFNSELWNSGLESDKEVARKQKRKLEYYSNIYVVSDSSNPQNEGKVFLFRYGKKIHDKLQAAMAPEFEDESPINPFDFWEGANFKLKIRKVDGYWNYDKSEFESPSALLEGDESKLDTVWKSQHSLNEFHAATNFKSYDELKKRMGEVLATSIPTGSAEDVMDDFPVEPSPVMKEEPAPTFNTADADEEDTMSYFEKLANE